MTKVATSMPTKRSNAQHLVEYEKQLYYEENKKSGDVMQQLMDYKYELRKYSHWVILTFLSINIFLSNSVTPILSEK